MQAEEGQREGERESSAEPNMGLDPGPWDRDLSGNQRSGAPSTELRCSKVAAPIKLILWMRNVKDGDKVTGWRLQPPTPLGQWRLLASLLAKFPVKPHVKCER